jgi:DNA-binding NarL/FixJ family response regulator
MRRLVFIDDDPVELKDFATVIEGHYNYTTVQWPDESAKLLNLTPTPDIFVSDLYLPATGGEATPTAALREAAAKSATEVAELFSGLYRDTAWDDKRRLRETMKAIDKAYLTLKKQWRGLGQSPDNGIALQHQLRDHYPQVPLVFYSRKLTPEDVMRVLRAGAVDAIRKGVLEQKELLARLDTAQELWRREAIWSIRNSGFNANVTLVSEP